MSLPPLPEAPNGNWWDSNAISAMQAYGQACYEKALLDAMNATLPFNKTGAVIAAAIRSLK